MIYIQAFLFLKLELFCFWKVLTVSNQKISIFIFYKTLDNLQRGFQEMSGIENAMVS